MTGEDVREVFETILPQQDIEQLCAQCGVIERQRKLHLGMLVWARVIGAGSPGGAYQAVSCQSIAQAFDVKGAQAKRRWEAIAELLMHSGKDPNWRRRPSVLDQLRGWKRQLVGRQQSNHGDLTDRCTQNSLTRTWSSKTYRLKSPIDPGFVRQKL